MVKLDLKKGQRVESIRMDKSDNGGFILSYTIYTDAPAKNQTGWEDKSFIYTKDKEEEAFNDLLTLYKEKLSKK